LVSQEIREQQSIHNNVVNVEKNGFDDYSVQELQKMMNEAIQKEDYETASKFRDLLKDKEK